MKQLTNALLLCFCLLAGSAHAKFGLSQKKYHLAKATALGAITVGNLYMLRYLIPELTFSIKRRNFLEVYAHGVWAIGTTYLANKAYESYKEFSTTNNDNNHKEHHETTN